MTDSDICFDYSNIIPFLILFYFMLFYFILFCLSFENYREYTFLPWPLLFLKKTRYRDSY